MDADDINMNENPCVLLKRLPEREVRQACKHLLWTEVEEKCVWRAGGLQRGPCAPLFVNEAWRFPEEEQEGQCRERAYTKSWRLAKPLFAPRVVQMCWGSREVGADQEKKKWP